MRLSIKYSIGRPKTFDGQQISLTDTDNFSHLGDVQAYRNHGDCRRPSNESLMCAGLMCI
jgi:hypothetical protein